MERAKPDHTPGLAAFSGTPRAPASEQPKTQMGPSMNWKEPWSPQCTVDRSNPYGAGHPDCDMGDWSHHHGEINDGAHPACDIGDWGHLHGESNEGPDEHKNIGNEASGKHRNGRGARPHFRRSGSSHQDGTRSGKQPGKDQTLQN